MRMNAADIRFIRPRADSLLGASFIANAAVQFAIQAWLAYSFAKHVWHLPGPLPFAAPVALDAFVVNMMVVTYELRTAHLRTRAYAWGVLSLGVLAQIGAAEGYALDQQWGWWARVASFAPALLLAASLHTLIIRRRQPDTSEGQGREVVAGAAPIEIAPETFDAWLARLQTRATHPLITTATTFAPAWVYLCLPVDGKAIYVGSSYDLVKRFADHRSRKDWWAEVDHIEIRPCASIDEALASERALIEEIDPVHNSKHTSRPQRRPTDQPAMGGRRQPHPDRELAVKRVLGGERAALVAKDLGLAKRTVEVWVATERKSRVDAISPGRLAADGALSPKETGPGNREMQGDVAGHDASNGTPAKDPSDRLQDR